MDWDARTILQKMKKHVFVVVGGTVLLLALSIVATVSHNRSLQRAWPAKQLENATTLGRALADFRRSYGTYPENLFSLVEGSTVTYEEFRNLRFSASPGSQPQEWLYNRPKSKSETAIVAPDWVFPWDGHSGYRVTASADGGGELILGTKDYRLPEWVTK